MIGCSNLWLAISFVCFFFSFNDTTRSIPAEKRDKTRMVVVGCWCWCCCFVRWKEEFDSFPQNEQRKDYFSLSSSSFLIFLAHFADEVVRITHLHTHNVGKSDKRKTPISGCATKQECVFFFFILSPKIYVLFFYFFFYFYSFRATIARNKTNTQTHNVGILLFRKRTSVVWFAKTKQKSSLEFQLRQKQNAPMSWVDRVNKTHTRKTKICPTRTL